MSSVSTQEVSVTQAVSQLHSTSEGTLLLDANVSPNVTLNPFYFFSSVTLHGLASTDGEACTIRLTRDESFPPKRHAYDSRGTGPNDTQWGPIAPPTDKLHADLQITEQLNEGRISIVFAARLISCSGSVPLPAQFCVKLAKSEYIRSLAREAWFYEQISKEDGYAGPVIPFCFGFFTSPLPESVRIPAWSSAEFTPEDPHGTPPDEEPIYDNYYDDEDDDQRTLKDDDRTSHLNSRWALPQWTSRLDRSPVVGVFITERLGSHFDSRTRNEYQMPDESRKDLSELLDDLTAIGVIHDDFKFNNILRPASQSWLGPQVCPRHNRVHPWRVIDFDRAFRFYTANKKDCDRYAVDIETQLGCGYFWGSW